MTRRERRRGCLPCCGTRDRSTVDEHTPLLADDRVDAALEDLRPIERLAAAFGALRAGSLPSNAQLLAALRSLLRSDLLQENARASEGALGGSGLSRSTQRLVDDARDVVEAAIALLESKNGP